MSLVLGILTVVAGILYIIWQYHKEAPGGLLMIAVSCAVVALLVYVVPSLLYWVVENIGYECGILFCVLYIAAIIFATLRIIFVSSTKWAEESASESTKIWAEVYNLPLPDAETLRKIKLANNIPVTPEDNKTYNDAAIRAWRVSEYNKRMKQRHKVVVHL